MSKSLNNISEVTRCCHVVMLYTLGQSIKVLSSLEEVQQVSRKEGIIKTSLGYFNFKNGNFIRKLDKSVNNMAHPRKLFVGFKPSKVEANVGNTVSVITLTEGSPSVVYTRERKIRRVSTNNGVLSALSLNDGKEYTLGSDGRWFTSYVSSFGYRCKDVVVDNLIR